MKVQLVVVQGKPLGAIIPLAHPKFKIGRGDGCQLKPNSELVSREHAQFELGDDLVFVTDLGSRNGTEVNGKKIAANEPLTLKSGDLIKVGSMTFAISIEGVAPAKAAPAAASPAARKPSSLDDVSGDEIDSWLVSDETRPQPDRASGVYGGDTITINTYNEKAKTPAPAAKAPTPAPAPAPAAKVEPEPAAEDVETFYEEPVEDDGIEDLSASQQKEEAEEMPEDMMDESNPFYVKKPTPADAAPAKAAQRDSSSAADDILRKIMNRRRASKSS